MGNHGRAALLLGLLALCAGPLHAASGSVPKHASFQQQHVSDNARQMADWVVDSGDNGGMPFVLVDKTNATVFVFYADGRLRGAAPALLGSAIGDDSVPGIGERKLADIKPSERTTPAGRFVASLGRNLHEEILWIDYDAAISMHRVVPGTARERRAQRLDSPSALDNRISYGCINVPVKFYETVLSPSFRDSSGIVYILPEVRSNHEVFASYDVERRLAAPPTDSGAPALR